MMKPLELMEQGRFLGEEFAIWLWMQSLVEGGGSGADGDGSGCFLDDSVVLGSERGEVKEIALKKGNPAESREAFEALARGMRPVSAKVRLLSGDLEWVFTLKPVSLDLAGMKMPPSTGKAPHERLHDRLFLAEEAVGHMERRYGQFLDQRTTDPEGLTKAINEWIRCGLSGEVMGSGGAPWEEGGD